MSRRYSMALRGEQLTATRRRILAAATELFTEHGYLGATLTAIATAAGVSVQTVYNVVGGKPALLKAAYDVMLAGDDEPVPIAERPMGQAIWAATDGRECLIRYAVLGRVIGERVVSLIMMLLAQAATGDRDLREFAGIIEAERASGNRMVAGFVAERFGLRAGLDADTAADILWALTAPELADRLVNRRGWDWDHYQRWLGETMADALLGPVQPAS